MAQQKETTQREGAAQRESNDPTAIATDTHTHPSHADPQPTSPAYRSANQAKTALGDKKYREALALIAQALALEEGESEFHEIHGLALIGLNRARDALQALDQAVALNARNQRAVLQRGILKYQLKSYSAAELDLLTSLQLMPTVAAYQTLGRIAEQERNCRLAIYYYQNALAINGSDEAMLRNKIAALDFSCF